MNTIMDFEQLLQRLANFGAYLQERAVVVVNRVVTSRNWFFGVFIIEYEQNGQDRAQYGEHLIERLSISLSERGLKGVFMTALKFCRQFYLTCPEIGQTVSDQLIVFEGQLECLQKLKYFTVRKPYIERTNVTGRRDLEPITYCD